MPDNALIAVLSPLGLALFGGFAWKVLSPLRAIWRGDASRMPRMVRVHPQARTYLAGILMPVARTSSTSSLSGFADEPSAGATEEVAAARGASSGGATDMAATLDQPRSRPSPRYWTQRAALRGGDRDRPVRHGPACRDPIRLVHADRPGRIVNAVAASSPPRPVGRR
jgi:hypothetical protein